MSFLDNDLPTNRDPLVRIKRRTIVVYLAIQTGLIHSLMLTDEAASTFRRLSETRHQRETKVLYFVRCSPRKRK